MRVDTVDLTGDVTFVRVHPCAAIVAISLSPGIWGAHDEAVWLRFEHSRIHLFDGKTQLARHTECVAFFAACQTLGSFVDLDLTCRAAAC